MVEFLRAVRSQATLKLIGIPIGAASPMKGKGREHSRNGVIGMARDAAFRAECQQYVRTKLAEAQGELIHDTVEFLPMELAVRIIENDGLRDAQDGARCSEFMAAKLGQFTIRLGPTAIGCGLAGREANDRRFGASIAINAQDSAEVTGFVVRVRGNAHQAKHAEIVADVQGTAEIVQLIAGTRNNFRKWGIRNRMRIRSSRRSGTSAGSRAI